jgi:hypothetical protein
MNLSVPELLDTDARIEKLERELLSLPQLPPRHSPLTSPHASPHVSPNIARRGQPSLPSRGFQAPHACGYQQHPSLYSAPTSMRHALPNFPDISQAPALNAFEEGKDGYTAPHFHRSRMDRSLRHTPSGKSIGEASRRSFATTSSEHSGCYSSPERPAGFRVAGPSVPAFSMYARLSDQAAGGFGNVPTQTPGPAAYMRVAEACDYSRSRGPSAAMHGRLKESAKPTPGPGSYSPQYY